MDILDLCRNIISNNTKKQINNEIIDILSYSILAIILTKQEIAIKKIPKILKELNIYAEEKSVIDIAHEKLSNYNEDQYITNYEACVTRTLLFDNNNFLKENKTLIISLQQKDNFNLIRNIIHEFMHLLRVISIEQNNDNYKIRNGISITYYNSTTEKLKRKHYYIEEGIVQYYTNIALSNLNTYIIDNKINTPIANEFIKKMKKYDYSDYLFQTTLIKKLCEDKTFSNLLDETFIDNSNPPKVITYYNDIFNSPCAFTDLSKEIDIISNSIKENEIITQFNKIKNLVSKYIIITKNKKDKH